MSPHPDVGPLHPDVKATAEAYLARARHLIDGLYLTGSVALDDYHAGRSDIDFVALTSAPLDVATVAAVHTALPGPSFDGIYLTRDQLAAGPLAIAETPFVHDSRVGSGRFEHSPVTWHVLADCGIRLHGPELSSLEIWTSAAVLAEQVRQNLDGYWRPHHRRLSTSPYSLSPAAAEWCVLGVPRLHYTLTTGQITSKTGAGDHARQSFDARWHPVIDDALRHRRGEAGRLSVLRRRRDMLDFTAMVLESARQLG